VNVEENMKGIEGKIVLVTGGSSGIGRATALAFARAGSCVAVADVMEEGGEQTVQMVREAGGDAQFFRADVSSAADVEALVRGVVDRFGRLDFAHNNAGVEGRVGPLEELTEQEFERVININLKGVWLCIKYEVPEMLKTGGGAIVNTASVAGLLGFANSSAYVASKHAVVGLTKTAALEYARRGIRVNAVCPGVILTPMVQRVIDANPAMESALAGMEPVGRLGTPEEIADAVVYLCSENASFVTGFAMAVDGGLIAQ
jgi:NAD(P)-dependent dehydrogenase (short-subunit alcohol dehydrogenase family)